MTQSWKPHLQWLGLAVGLGVGSMVSASPTGTILLNSDYANAQITPDSTLGTERSIVVPNTPVQGFPADVIRGGATRGINLFHSFLKFNVKDGQRVYFANPTGIENILSQVTGADPSKILGTLGVDGRANLFLLNPNGIIFGPNARLDVAGSFVATTANSFKFPDGSEFSATQPQAPPLLTVNITPGLQYGKPVGNIQQAGNLAVPAGQSLTLYGNTVTSTGKLIAPGGTVQVLGDRVSLLDQAAIDVSSSTGGGTVLIGGDFQGKGQVPTATQTFVDSNVTINADGISPTFHSPLPSPAHGGKVIVWANEATQFYGNISARGGTRSGDGGFVEVSGSKLTFQGLVDTTAATGKTGTLLLDPDNITIGFASTIPGDQLMDPAMLATALNTNSVTVAATNAINVTETVRANSPNDLTLQAKDVAISNNASLLQLGGGNIILDTTQNVGTPLQTIQGTSVSVSSGSIRTQVLPGATNNGGNVQITTGSLTVTNGAQLDASTFGVGNAGNVIIDARDSIVFRGASTVNGQVSGAFSSAEAGSTGKGGDISIFTSKLEVSGGAVLSAVTRGPGNAGNVSIDTLDFVIFRGTSSVDGQISAAFSTVEPGATGRSGNVTISTGILEVSGGAQLRAETRGQADAGSVLINARDRVSFTGTSEDGQILSQAFSGVGNGARGEGGDVIISTGILEVFRGARLRAGTSGRGNAGNVTIKADRVFFDGSSADGRVSAAFSTVERNGEGQGGNVSVTTGSLSVINGAALTATTFGRGNAGNVTIKADRVSFSGISADKQNLSGAFSAVGENAIGRGGNVDITTGSLSVIDGAALSATTRGQGDAGNVIVKASDFVVFRGASADGKLSTAFSNVASGVVGNGGDVIISTGILEVSNGARLRAETSGIGDAGNVIISARDRVFFNGTSPNGQVSGAFSSVEGRGQGQGGNVEITTGSLSVTNGAALSAATFRQGNAGNVIINARDRVSFDGISPFVNTITGLRTSSGAFSSTATTGIGQGGNVNITTGSLSVTNGAVLSASTFAQGNAGNVIINARDSVFLDGQDSGAFSAVNSTGHGEGGNIDITTGSLSAINGARLSVSTFNQGNAGNVIIKARDSVSFRGSSANGQSSGVFSIVAQNSEGQGGNIDITTSTLSVTSGARLDTSTFGRGDAGKVIIKADRVSLTGVSANRQQFPSGVFSRVEGRSTGQGGDVNITTGFLSITNGALLSVSSFAAGAAGDINVTADSIRFDRGAIASQANFSNGGNITLNVQDTLLLRRGSYISTTAGRANTGGDGGNIRFNGGFIVAVPKENSDIFSNAFTGRGGRVDVTAQGIYGTQFRPRLTPLSDITASSTFGISGVVTLDTPDIDPSRGLVSLPATFVDPSQQIDRRCQPASAQSRGSFVITGRGGLPTSPTESLQSEEGLVEWVLVEEGRGRGEESRETARSSPVVEIVEATRLIREPDGTIALVADLPTGSPEFWWNSAACLGSQSSAR